jgi:hypothetical protein
MSRPPPASRAPDFVVENHGNIFLFYPRNDLARKHLHEVTDGQWLGGALAVEHRYARDLAQALLDDGWEVR